MKKIIHLFISLLIFSESAHLQAREPFHASITVDSITATVSAPNLVDLNRDLQTRAIEEVIPFYTPTSPVAIDVNLRGLIALTSFAENSTTLVVNIPNADITQTFTGATRDESWKLFKEFIKEGRSIPKLLKAYTRHSPIDPIAGNPNSLMAQMAQADYLMGKLSPLSGCDCSWSAQPIVHQFQLGTYAGRAFTDGYDVTQITLPMRYSYSPNQQWALILDAPFTYNRNGGASSVFGSFGTGVRLPILNDWSITTVVRLGAGGSLDLCTSGSFFSAGVVSEYNYKLCDYVFSLTNYIGYFASTNLWLSGVNFNYNLRNTVFKNGLSATTCKEYCLLGRPIYFKVAFEDSYFAGDRLFIRHFDEVSFSFITYNVSPCIDYDNLSIGFSYQFGQKDYRGYFLNLAYQF